MTARRFRAALTVSALMVAAGACGAVSKRDDAEHDGGDELVLCPGTVAIMPSPQACRSQEDCASDRRCQAPATPLTILCPLERCQADGDCAEGKVCVPGACGLECQPRCEPTSCPQGHLCGTDGKCQPEPCEGGAYACGTDLTCAAERPGADGHGCAPASCSSDGYVCPSPATCSESLGQDGHGCNVPRCDQSGVVCPANFRCDALASTPDGCVRMTCAIDGDCDCGACALGACYDQPFECVALLL